MQSKASGNYMLGTNLESNTPLNCDQNKQHYNCESNLKRIPHPPLSCTTSYLPWNSSDLDYLPLCKSSGRIYYHRVKFHLYIQGDERMNRVIHVYSLYFQIIKQIIYFEPVRADVFHNFCTHKNCVRTKVRTTVQQFSETKNDVRTISHAIVLPYQKQTRGYMSESYSYGNCQKSCKGNSPDQ